MNGKFRHAFHVNCVKMHLFALISIWNHIEMAAGKCFSRPWQMKLALPCQGICHELNRVPSCPKLICWCPNPQLVLRDRAFGRWLGLNEVMRVGSYGRIRALREPCKDTMRNWPSMSQEENSHQNWQCWHFDFSNKRKDKYISAYVLKLYTGASKIKWPQREICRQVILPNE